MLFMDVTHSLTSSLSDERLLFWSNLSTQRELLL